MRRTVWLGMALCLSCSALVGMGSAKKTESAGEAIKNSQSLPTAQEKAAYLVKQAETFYNSKNFQQAVETAQYVLSNLDSNSQPAKDLIAKAKTQLKAAAKKAVGDMSNKFFGQ